MKVPFLHTLNFLFCCFTVVLIPLFPKGAPIAIILLLASTTGVWISDRTTLKFIGVKQLLLSMGIFIAYVIGLLFSDNFKIGLSNIETKLSLLVFPIIFFSSRFYTKQQQRQIFQWFILACFVTMLVCIANGFYNYFDEKMEMAKGIPRDNFGYYYFFSSRLSPWLHPSYLAMYLLFALSINYFMIFESGILRGVKAKTVLSLLMVLFVLLLSSKAGIIALGIFGVFVFIHQVFVLKKILAPLLLLLFFAISFTFLYTYVSEFSTRINNAITALTGNVDAGDEESSAQRVKIWDASTSLIKKNFWMGVGTGDVSKTLVTEYTKRGMTYEAEKELNCHNQYLQTALALGILGIIALTAFMVNALVIAFRYRSWIFISFILLVVINFLVESMLETQSGVMFVSFFNAFLIRSVMEDKNELVNNNKT